MSATLSVTETQVFTSLRAVLSTFGLTPTNPNTTLDIIRAQMNRVPEPAGPDFVVMWQLSQERLAMNVQNWADNTVIGSIAGNVLDVTEMVKGIILAGQPLYGAGIFDGCRVLQQTGGTPGGIGTYSVTPTPDVMAETIYSGTKAIETDVEWTIQADVHGPSPGNAGDNARLIETLWRDQYAVDACNGAGDGLIAPLSATTPRQLAFENAEMQFEERWTIDLCLQVNPIVTVPAQFATTGTTSARAVQSLAA